MPIVLIGTAFVNRLSGEQGYRTSLARLCCPRQFLLTLLRHHCLAATLL
ncbi:MAG TPA: hypothetical protein VM911_06150 [Pyrinomonadaceae bacterium]|nr:hypothetical protein [Pyrinomonadaceae bacterium]